MSKFIDMKNALNTKDYSRWRDKTENIKEERALIARYLYDGILTSVYGFSTLLGQLDNVASTRKDQTKLLNAYLSGTPEGVSTDIARWLTAVKLELLSNGGSGISVKSYEELIRFLEEPKLCQIDFDASYSSGDVVPASWWINSIFLDSEELRTGDLIALMNGNFVSLGMTAYAYSCFLDYVCRFLSMLKHYNLYSDFHTDLERNVVVSLGIPLLPVHSAPQPSVLERDIRPVLDLIFTSVREGVSCIDASLSHPSANPLFKFEDDKVLACSNSSFLNYMIPHMLCGSEYTLSVIARISYSLIGIKCREKLHGTDKNDPKWVQPPKDALEYCVSIESSSINLAQTTGAESDGMENSWDTGLIHALHFLEQLEKAKKLQNIFLQVSMPENERVLLSEELLSMADFWKLKILKKRGENNGR